MYKMCCIKSLRIPLFDSSKASVATKITAILYISRFVFTFILYTVQQSLKTFFNRKLSLTMRFIDFFLPALELAGLVAAVPQLGAREHLWHRRNSTTNPSPTGSATPVTTGVSVRDDSGASHCGQWDSVPTGEYTIQNLLWGEAMATSGSQCFVIDGLSGNTVAWTSEYHSSLIFDVRTFAKCLSLAGPGLVIRITSNHIRIPT